MRGWWIVLGLTAASAWAEPHLQVEDPVPGHRHPFGEAIVVSVRAPGTVYWVD